MKINLFLLIVINFSTNVYSVEIPIKGEILYYSTLEYMGRPQFTGNTSFGFYERAKQELQPIKYSRYVKTIYDGNKVHIDVDIIPNPQFPNPVSNTYIYDGKDMYFLDNVNGIMVGVIDKNTPLRLTSLDYINMPGFCFGYDVDGIDTLVRNIKNDIGDLPNIQKYESPVTTEISGLFPNSTNEILLCSIKWLEDNIQPFKEAVYIQPKYNVVVKINNKDFKLFDQIKFPTNVEIQVFKTSSIQDYESSNLILKNTITILSAEFDSALINQENFFTSTPVGYATGN